jgi:hypothetical protein
MLPLVALKYLSADRSASHTCCNSRRDVGPCSASAATLSEMSSMPTSRPDAFSENHRRLGSAAVHRYSDWPVRVTVPSSITLPYSSHHGV